MSLLVVTHALSATAAIAALPDDALIDAGSRKLEAGDARAALADFTRAAQQAPRDPRPLYLGALARQKLGDRAGAEAGLRAALGLDPKLAEVRNELGALLTEAGRPADAAVELRRAVADRPDLTEAWFNLGQAELQQRRCAPALDAFRHAAQLAPRDADGWINLSAAARKCQAANDAQAAARQAVQLAPSSAPAHLNLGLALQAGAPDRAADEFTAATRLKPDYVLAWWSLGLVERARHRPDAAIAALDKARALSPSAPRLTDLGLAHRDRGDFQRAAALFREALALDPRYTPARWHLAQAEAALHQCRELARTLAELPPAEARSEAAQKLARDCK